MKFVGPLTSGIAGRNCTLLSTSGLLVVLAHSAAVIQAFLLCIPIHSACVRTFWC